MNKYLNRDTQIWALIAVAEFILFMLLGFYWAAAICIIWFGGFWADTLHNRWRWKQENNIEGGV